jgi:hypothetical protein
MESEILFIVILIAPWVLVLGALFFYRQRRLRKMQHNPGDTGERDRSGA